LEDRIRLRAYCIWLAEGKPEGRHLVHWEAAREAIAGEEDEPHDKPIQFKPALSPVPEPER
jgi:hypothetical protein